MSWRSWFGVVWGGIWFAYGVPWSALHPHPHFSRILWIPFGFAPLRDAVLNVLFYIPMGLVFSSAPWAHVVMLAGALSSVTELTQLFSITRVPSVTDLVLNVSGAALGWTTVRLVRGGHNWLRASRSPEAL